jgi:6-pyruvoyltetrahydropterin/6-carboxytetrahydropterin synthase
MSPVQTIKVRHNAEMAHRLLLTPGKCQQIHGHSFTVELELVGQVSPEGLLCQLDFANVKALFRKHLDAEYDHHILLNAKDPWAGLFGVERQDDRLPGLSTMSVDPTTENIAARIGLWAQATFTKYGIAGYTVTVWETKTNCATWTNYIMGPS